MYNHIKNYQYNKYNKNNNSKIKYIINLKKKKKMKCFVNKKKIKILEKIIN